MAVEEFHWFNNDLLVDRRAEVWLMAEIEYGCVLRSSKQVSERFVDVGLGSVGVDSRRSIIVGTLNEFQENKYLNKVDKPY